MTAVLSVQTHDLSREENLDSEQGPNGFMAVNGKESPRRHLNGNGRYHSSRLSSDSSDHRSETTHGSQSYPHVNGNSEQNSAKRKRSLSFEHNENSPSRYDYNPPKRAEQTQQVADRALNVLVNSEKSGNPAYTENHAVSRPLADSDHWYQPNGNKSGDVGGRSDVPDVQMVEALQQVTQDEQEHSREWSPTDLAGSNDREDLSPDQSTHTSVNGKRKRQFSNRTKTGCLTCRRRKKKCDERHPKCNNCEKGGFPCQGYNTTRDTWRIPDNKHNQHLAAQGKNPYYDFQGGVHHPSISPPDAKQTAFGREGGHTRPMAPEEHDSSTLNFTSSPHSTEPRSRGSYSGQSWPPQHGHPQYNNHTSESLPPYPEITAHDPSRAEYTNAPVMRDMSRSNAPNPTTHPSPQTASWQRLALPADRPNHPAPRMESTAYPQPPPRTALSGYSSASKVFTAAEVERSKMGRGASYNHFDPSLENERLRCDEACERYNSACKLRNGVSRPGQEEMLQKIFDPSLDTAYRAMAPHQGRGLLGPGVRVEAPFSCTYGYNIQLFDNAYIGKNCEIDDAAPVTIGARVWIGPNVTIFTSDVGRDMIDRKGTDSRWMARQVKIHEEAIIGRNATIYPGVTINRGCVVEPNAVVKDSVPENQIARACPGPPLST